MAQIGNTGFAVLMSPVFIAGISYTGAEKVTQKVAIASKLPSKTYSEEISAEQIKRLLRPRIKFQGKWYYIGTRKKFHFFASDILARNIFRVNKSEYEIKEQFPLTAIKSKWREIEIRNTTPQPTSEQ